MPVAEMDPGLKRQAKTGLPLPDCVALVLQGGGALGSYQAGVYQALAENGIEVDKVAGISIGAINAALIAGNPPERRLERLTEFWELVSSWLPSFPIPEVDQVRELVHEWSAGFVLGAGVPGFFTPRWFPPQWAPKGSPGALSYYDSTPLRRTLDRLVDWDLLNDGPVSFAVGVVDVRTGNFDWFRNRAAGYRIDARHVMASGALPPGLPPVQIGEEFYWDGGIVSNTPLQDVLERQDAPMLVFQVDLFRAEGEVPETMEQVVARAKEIRFSSRTRQINDQLLARRKERQQIAALLDKLPPELAADPDAQALRNCANDLPVWVVQLILDPQTWEGDSRDFEFSERTMRGHWAAGHEAVRRSFANSQMLAQDIRAGKTAAFDLIKGQRKDYGSQR